MTVTSFARTAQLARVVRLSAVALAALVSLPTLAVGQLADITVVDRNTGATLPVYQHRGEYWVAGTPGTRYGVAVQSRHSQRLLVVPSVDGVNVLSGQTAAWYQTGYVFSGHGQYQITGWRKSSSEVAAFEFSSLGDSYAGLTGRPANVGVIGVALFKEKRPPAPAYDQQWRQKESAEALDRSKSIASPAPAAAAPSAGSAERMANESSDMASPGSSASANAGARRSAPQAAAKLGTAHGQRESSVVSETEFERRSAKPDEVVLIRYDSRANLVALGVIRVPPSTPSAPSPSAFPDSTAAYVPDPPQRRY